MILIPHRPEAGLFSQINFLITHIDALGHAEFFVDWSEGILYSTGDGVNVFEELFVQKKVRDEDSEIVQEWPHHRYTGPGADPLYLSGSWWRARLHDCWEQLTVRRELLDEVEAYVRRDETLRIPAGKPEPRYQLVRKTLKEESPVSVLH